MESTTPTGRESEPTWNIAEKIEQQALLHPAAPALILRDKLASFREMVVAIHAIAHALLEGGVRAGETVGVSMGQTHMHLLTLLAIARIGAVSIPLHPLVPQERRRLAVDRFGVTVVVSALADMRLDGVRFVFLGNVDLGSRTAPPPACNTQPDDPFRIVMSSGTSGAPKAMLFKHGYMLDRIEKTNYACTAQSRLLPMDLNFPIGFLFSMGVLSVGGAVAICPSNAPADLVYMVRAHAVTHWLLSPAMAESIASLLVDDDIHFPSLQHLRIVGATPSARLLETLFARFSPNVFVPYGSTEIGAISIATPDILKRAPASAGRIAPWLTLEVVDEDDQLCAAGQSGRLRMKAEGMIASYYLDPAHTAERFRDGWYYPRDLGCIDVEGLLSIEGREDDVFNLKGSKVYFRDIERELQSHPAVREAAAFAAHGDGVEAILVAFIPNQPIAEAELAAWAAVRLGPLKPQRFFAVKDLPRNAAGKVMRDEIAGQIALLAAEMAGGVAPSSAVR